MPWVALLIECDICGMTWAAVAPVGAIEAECPKCGHFCAIPGCWDAIEAWKPEGQVKEVDHE